MGAGILNVSTHGHSFQPNLCDRAARPYSYGPDPSRQLCSPDYGPATSCCSPLGIAHRAGPLRSPRASAETFGPWPDAVHGVESDKSQISGRMRVKGERCD